jgi:hypothetical protein
MSILVVGLATGCATTSQPQPDPATAAEPAETVTMTVPVGPDEGRVTVADLEHGFVVLDYGAQPVPAIGTIVTVYRGEDARIGEVKLTEPRQGRLISADILDGEPQVGDVVR